MVTMSFLHYVGLHPVSAPAPPNQGVPIWTRTENPSSTLDQPARVAVDGTGSYVIGYDYSPGNAEWRIEKRSLGDGSIIWTQVENPSTDSDSPSAVAVDGTGLYVAGNDLSLGGTNFEWRIEKRSLTTGAITWTQIENPSTGFDVAYALAVDGSGLYVAGVDQVLGNTQWRIEKRSLTTGALIATFGTAGVELENPSSSSDSPLGLAVDGSGLYVVGYDAALVSNEEWHIEKRSLTTGLLVAAFGSGGVAVDNPSSGNDDAYAVVVDGTGVYVVGIDQVPGNPEWRIEKLQLSDGSPVSAFGSSGVVQEDHGSGDDEPSAQVAIDGTGIYVPGYDQLPGNYEWRVEKFGLGDGSVAWSQTENPSTSGDEAYGIAVDGTGVYVAGVDQTLGN